MTVTLWRVVLSMSMVWLWAPANSGLAQDAEPQQQRIPNPEDQLVEQRAGGVDLTEAEEAWLRQHPVLRVGNENDWKPFDFAEDGEALGYSIDHMRLIAEKLGIQLEFVNGYSWAQLMEQFRNGELDIMPVIADTPERRNFTTFTQHYMTNPTVLVTAEDTLDINDISHLNGRRVAIVEGYYYEETIRGDYPDVEVVPVSGFLEGLETVLYGKADAFIGSQIVIHQTIKENAVAGLRIAGRSGVDDLDRFKLKIGVRKSAAILAGILDKAMDVLTAEEKQALDLKWLPVIAGVTGQSVSIALSAEERKWLSEHQHIRLGVDPLWPPFEFLNENGSHGGLAAGYVGAVVKRLNIEMKPLTDLSWSQVMEKARAGEVDMLPAVMATPEREEFLNFTKPYATFPIVVATHTDRPFISGLEGLAGKKVGVVKDYFIEEALQRDHRSLELIGFSTLREALQALNDGNIDAYVDSMPTISHQVSYLGLTNIKISAPTDYTIALAMGVRKDWPHLIGLLNRALDDVDQEERRVISNAWLALPIQYGMDFRTIIVWATPIGFSVIVVVLIVVVWNRRLGREITERKQAEKAARRTHEQTMAILWESPFGVTVTDKDTGRMMFANPRSAELFGLSEEKMASAEAHQFYADPEERSAVMKVLQNRGEVRDHEVRMRHADGSEFCDLMTLLPFDFEHQPGLLGWHHDITERKRAEDLIDQQSQLFGQVLDTVLQGVVKLDRERRFETWNKQYEDIFGVPDGFLEVGQSIEKLTRLLAEKGDFGEGDVETLVEQRLEVLRSDEATRREATLKGGRTLDIAAEPTSDGGLVTTYTDISERKAAEESLRRSEQNLSNILNNSPIGIAITSTRDSKRLYLNARFLAMMGASSEAELISARQEDSYVDPDGFARVSAELTQDDPNVFAEAHRKRLDGTTWWAFMVRTRVDYHGEDAFLNWHIDITERKQAEETLASKEAQLRLALDNMSDGIFALDADLRYLLFNDRYVSLTGLDPSLFAVGKPIRDVVTEMARRGYYGPGDPGAQVEQRMTEFRREEYHEAELTTDIGLTLTSRMIALTEGGVVVVISDITERKQAEEEVLLKESQLRLALDNMSEGIFVLDSDLRYQLFNDRYVALTGLHPRLFAVGKPFRDVIVEAARLGYYGPGDPEAQIAQRMAMYRRKEFDEVEVTTDTGLTLTSRKTALSEGGSVVVFSDITERKQAEREIVEAKEVAEEATKAKATFLATMSHEIRTPMNGVIGMADLMAQTELGGDQRQMLNTIRDSGNSLLTIINDILDFSKIEAGKLEIEAIAMSLADVVEGAAATLGVNAAKKGLRLVTHVDPRLPPFVLGDSVRMRQIMFNLIGNAIKFTEAGEVVARADLVENGGLAVRFSIIDQGIGISQEGQGKLFQAFSQAEASTTRKFGGTGLGLTICQRLAELMGGEIGVDSALGEGSTFHVTLPFAVAEEGRGEAREFDLSGLAVQVISSSDAERGACEATLAAAGATLTGDVSADVVVLAEAGDAQAALALAEQAFDSGQRLVLARIRTAETGPLDALDNVTFVDANPIRGAGLLRAVAVAAGRASPEIDYAAEIEALPKRAAPTPEEALARGELILLAEDNVTNQDVIRRQLAVLGYACEIADDGALALDAWRAKPYALLLTDCHMPNMDGFELTAAIRGDEVDSTARARIVAITANALEGEAERCIAAGMDDYLSKPVALPALKATLEKWMPAGSGGGGGVAPEPISVPTEASDAVVDPAFLRDSFGDDGSLIAEILGDYVQPALDIVAEIDAAYAAHSATSVGAAAHKLKSASRSIGANALADLCERLEAAGKADDWDAIEADYADLAPSMAEVKAHIDGL
jgi:PAS domain S-box-containing protein